MLFFFVTFDYWDAYYYAAMDQPIDVFYGVGLIRLDVSPKPQPWPRGGGILHAQRHGSGEHLGDEPDRICPGNRGLGSSQPGNSADFEEFPFKKSSGTLWGPHFYSVLWCFFWKKMVLFSLMFLWKGCMKHILQYDLFSFIYVSVLILNSSFGCLLFVAPLVLIGGLGICMPKFFAQYPLETKYIHCISWYFMWIYRHYIGIQLLQRLYIYIYIICIYIYLKRFVSAWRVFEIAVPGRLLVDTTVPIAFLCKWQCKFQVAVSAQVIAIFLHTSWWFAASTHKQGSHSIDTIVWSLVRLLRCFFYMVLCRSGSHDELILTV